MAYPFSEILIISWHTKILERLLKKNQGNKIEDSGEAYDINLSADLLVNLNSVWKENSATLLFCLFTLASKQKS